MSAAVRKSFDAPDELRTQPKGSVAVVDLGGTKVPGSRSTLAGGGRNPSSRSRARKPARRAISA